MERPVPDDRTRKERLQRQAETRRARASAGQGGQASRGLGARAGGSLGGQVGGSQSEPTGPPLGRREVKKRETRGAIQYTARTLFETRGYEGTTIRAIADEAGVGVGTVHLHFKDKKGLLLACTIDELERADQGSWARMPKDASIKEQLLRRATDGFEQWARQPSLAKTILRNLYFSRRPEIRRLRTLDEEAAQRIADLLRVGQDQGEIRKDADPELAARAIFSFYLTSVLDWLGGIEGDPLEQEEASHSSSARQALEEKVGEVERFLDQVFMGIGTDR
jgi:AcrR family transcriptional regulator